MPNEKKSEITFKLNEVKNVKRAVKTNMLAMPVKLN
jgi:hypothetical protein